MSDAGYYRLLISLGVFSLVALGELVQPRRALHFSRVVRWWRNLGLILLDSATVLLILPSGLSMVALYAQHRQWGLFNHLPAGEVMIWCIGLLAMDLVVYWQHRWFHRLPFLWRFHKVHHLDLDLDVTSGLRFHPVEILLSLGIKGITVLVLGLPPAVVLVSEIVINSAAMFNHGNLALPFAFDHWLRKILVTPDMHRVHHSTLHWETDSNYGFCLSWWDRLFASYIPQPQQGHPGMALGIARYRNFKEQTLWYLLCLPFK